MPVVTISGNIAGGALEVGRLAAERLGIDLVDQQLLVEAAHRCGVPVGVIAERDERAATFGERLASLLSSFLERSAASGVDPAAGASGLEAILSRTYAEMAQEQEEPQVSDVVYHRTISRIISELGQQGDIILLGRGSRMILAEMPGVLHVLCIAPQEIRIERLAAREGISPAEAAKRTKDFDRVWRAYYRKFWKIEPENPRLYDLTVNTGRVCFETAAELVVVAARARV